MCGVTGNDVTNRLHPWDRVLQLIRSTTLLSCSTEPATLLARTKSLKPNRCSIEPLERLVQKCPWTVTTTVTSFGTRPFAVRRKGLGTCPHPYGMQLCVVISDLWRHHVHVRR